MDTKELVKKLNGVTTDCYAEIESEILKIYVTSDEGDDVIFRIDITADNIFRGITEDLEKLELGVVTEFGNIINEFIRTPLEKRIPEEKFYLMAINPLVKNLKYLVYSQITGNYTYGDKHWSGNKKTIYTQSEIDYMDISGLKPEPVEE